MVKVNNGLSDVENLEAILAVEGVDGFIVGPYDLSGSLVSLGDFEHPEMRKAMDHIAETARHGDKPGGLHVVEPDPVELRRRIQEVIVFWLTAWTPEYWTWVAAGDWSI